GSSALGAKSAASTPSAGTPQYHSGLAAAFSNDIPAASLGALENDGISFSLSSVDGADEHPPPDTAFEPPQSAMSASIGPPPDTSAPDKANAPDRTKPAPGKAGKPSAPAKPSKRELPKDEPLDLFIPPDAQGAELKVDIADDEHEFTRKRASTPAP